jgi:hypothetical protein
MPKVFKAPASKVATQGKTNYLAVTGDEYAIDREKGRAFAEFTDGLPNTILVVEAGDERAVPWTKPDDLTVDEKQPAAGLTLRPNGFLAAFGDTGVRLIPMEIDPGTLNGLFTRSGGEAVQRPK